MIVKVSAPLPPDLLLSRSMTVDVPEPLAVLTWTERLERVPVGNGACTLDSTSLDEWP